MAGIAADNRVDFSALCCTRCGLNRATRPPQEARRGGGELKSGGPAAGGGRRKKMDPGRVYVNGSGSEVFEKKIQKFPEIIFFLLKFFLKNYYS